MMEMCVMKRFINSPVEREIPIAMKERSQKIQKYHTTQQQELSKLANQPSQRQIQEWIINGYVMLDPGENPCDLQRNILEKVERICSNFHLSKILCSSRSPDFLVDIMQRQGAKLAISWLIPIIKDDPAALSNLPVSALIHLLFVYIDSDFITKSPEDFILLLREFKKYFDDSMDSNPTKEVIKLLFSDLNSSFSRERVKRASNLIFNSSLSSTNNTNNNNNNLNSSPASLNINLITNSSNSSSSTSVSSNTNSNNNNNSSSSSSSSLKNENNEKLKVSNRNRSSMFSPSPRKNSNSSPADFTNLRLSTGNSGGNTTTTNLFNLINNDQINELQKIMKKKPSFQWLSSLKKLKHFQKCKKQIFNILRQVLLTEDIENDFYSILLFLDELSILLNQNNDENHNENYQSLLAITIGKVLCGRRIINEKLFKNSNIYSKSIEILYNSFQFYHKKLISHINNDGNDDNMDLDYPNDCILVKLPNNNLFFISEFIIRGLLNILCLFCRFKEKLNTNDDDDDDMIDNQVNYNEIGELLFKNHFYPLFKRESSNIDYIPLLTKENSFDLICSNESIMYESGVYFFQVFELFNIIKLFGISISCMKIIFYRLLHEIQPEDLKNIFNSLQINLKSIIHQRIQMFISLGIDEYGIKLLQILQLTNDDTIMISNHNEINNLLYKKTNIENQFSMEIDSNHLSYNKIIKNLSISDVKNCVILNNYFNFENKKNGNDKEKYYSNNDILLDGLIYSSKLEFNKENENELKKLWEILEIFISQLEHFITNKQKQEEIFFHFSPNLIIKLIDCIKICEINLFSNNLFISSLKINKNQQHNLTNQLCLIFKKELKSFLLLNNNKKGNNSIFLLLNYLKEFNLNKKHKNNDNQMMIDSISIQNLQKLILFIINNENSNFHDDHELFKDFLLPMVINYPRINLLEEFLSKYILLEPRKLFICLLHIINDHSSFIIDDNNDKNHKYCLGILLDSIESCYDVTDDKDKEFLFQFIFIHNQTRKELINHHHNRRFSFILVLMSLILHHGSWNDMKHCCDWIFSNFIHLQSNNFNVTNALEFIRSFIIHPRSWSGFTTNEESTLLQKLPTLYDFTPNKLLNVIDFIIQEQKNNVESDNSSSSSSSSSLSNRMNLIQTILQQKKQNLHSIIVYLINKYSLFLSSNIEVQSIKQIQIILYLTFPQQIYFSSLLHNNTKISDNNEDSMVNTNNNSTNYADPTISKKILTLDKNSSSQLDITFHRLLRCLLDANLCDVSYRLLCSLAVQHKKIFFRYLPIMTALIQGRSHLTPTAFIEKQFYRLYMHCLGILDLLRPDVFISPDLNDFLQCYFILLENWCLQHYNYLTPLIEKFIHFLCFYSLDFFENLYPYISIFKNVAKNYPEIDKISILLNVITSNGKNHFYASSLLNDISLRSNDILIIKQNILLWKNNLHTFSNPISSKDQLIHESSVELNKLNQLHIDSIHFFTSELIEIISCPFPELRNIAFTLLLNYLNYCPSSSSIIIPGYLRCLHATGDILSDALTRAQNFYFFAQG